MSSYQVSAARVAAIVESWAARRSSEPSAAASCGALVALFGELTANTLENQRGQAMIQYVLDAEAPVADVGLLVTQREVILVHTAAASITAPTPTVSIQGGSSEYKITVIEGLEAAKAALVAATSGASVGCALKEFAIQEGAFASAFIAHLRTSCVDSEEKLVESAVFLGEILFVKDADAQRSISKAAVLCSTVFRRYVRKLLETESARAQPATLYELRERLCERLANPALIEGLEGLPNASEYTLAGGLTASLFHKGTYVEAIQVPQPTLDAVTRVPLRSDVVVVRYGAKNRGNTAFFARTLIFDAAAPPQVKDAYKFVYDVSEKVVALLVPGAVLAQVYSQARSYAESLNPTLASHLSKTFGFTTGLLVLEARGTIAEKATSTVVADGMAFVVRVCLEKVPVAGNENDTFDVELADTVLVTGGAAEVKTKASRKLEEIVYVAPEDEDDAKEDGAFERQQRDLAKITRQGQSDTVLMSTEAKRDEQLKVLLRELNAELTAAGGKKGTATSSEELRLYEVGQLAYGELRALSPEELQHPPAAAKKGIYVQADKKVVWLPVCGKPVPFHLSTVSKADVKMQGDQYQFTVVFHTLQEANAGYKLNRTKAFVKELTYSSHRDVFSEVQGAIQGQIQRIKNEDALRRRHATSADSGKLKLAMPANLLRLPQVKMRPVVSVGRQNKAGVGNLELHENGLRFTMLGATPVDILFDNVKHIIFQPAALSALSVIYHVTLKKSIEVGRKPTTEVQFMAEVMESSEVATGTRRSFDEEVAAEERDSERINSTNQQFMRFARAVEQRSKIKTQLPVSNFSFQGEHSRGMTVFKGSREVLWAVSEWPAFTQNVEEVELVSLERVIATGATFDMTLVFKDYNRPVQTITVPKEFLNAVKDWCLNARLYYTESSVNPNWRTTLKEIREDPEWNPWSPSEGWAVLNNDGDDDEEGDDSDGSESSDSTYYEEEDEETSDDDDSSWMEDEESDVSSGSDDDDESAVSWDEAERRAERADRKHGLADDDDDDRRPHKRARTTGGPSVARAANAPSSALPRPGAPSSKMPVTYGSAAVPPPRRF